MKNTKASKRKGGAAVGSTAWLDIDEYRAIQKAYDEAIDRPRRPCPFCGCEDSTIETVDDSCVIQCKGCITQGPFSDDAGEASARWNQRVSNDQAQRRAPEARAERKGNDGKS